MSLQHAAILVRNRPALSLAGPRSPVSWAISAVTGMFHAIANSYRSRRNIGQLKGLSAATLRDIGIDRSEIMSLVHEKAHGCADRRHALD